MSRQCLPGAPQGSLPGDHHRAERRRGSAGEMNLAESGRVDEEEGKPRSEATPGQGRPLSGTLGPGNNHCSALLEAQLPRDSLGDTASSSSMDPAKGAPAQPGPPEGLGLRPKRSWGALEEAMCPLCKRTRSGALERP
ncbi:uncharacterized protein C16orf90 homolog isoform X1 [Ictidomys tridecemlineatus]